MVILMRSTINMKNTLKTLTVLILLIVLNACQSKTTKQIAETESQYFTDSIFSKNLSEYRKHNVYLPKGFDEASEYPIIYATDGNTISEKKIYKKIFDSLIANKIIKPVIFVESHSNGKIADSTSITTGDGRNVKLNYRNFEYTRDYETSHKDADLASRFKNHMLYFADEFIPSIEKQLNQNINKEDRYFYGYSNGAGFGVNLLNKHPDLIGTYLCFSTFGGDAQTNAWKTDVDYPNLYLKYGSKEPVFLDMDAQFIEEKYTALNAFIDVEKFEGGHDGKIWKQKFTETISKLLKYD